MLTSLAVLAIAFSLAIGAPALPFFASAPPAGASDGPCDISGSGPPG